MGSSLKTGSSSIRGEYFTHIQGVSREVRIWNKCFMSESIQVKISFLKLKVNHLNKNSIDPHWEYTNSKASDLLKHVLNIWWMFQNNRQLTSMLAQRWRAWGGHCVYRSDLDLLSHAVEAASLLTALISDSSFRGLSWPLVVTQQLPTPKVSVPCSHV